MKIAYITRIKDEERLIRYNLNYYYNLGIRAFFICLNNSNTETVAEVNRFKKEHPDIEYYEFIDKKTDYNHSNMFNIMSDDAYVRGYAWQVPVDADEILHIKCGRSLQDILRPYDRAKYGYVNLRWIDYQPSHLDNPFDLNYFTRWEHREPVPRPPSKIIYKWSPGCLHGDGHHLLISKRNFLTEISPDTMFQAHFVNRERDQIQKKRIRIGEAFIETYGPDSEKPQVKEYREWQKRGDVYFDEVWENLCQERKLNFQRYVHDPIDKKLFT
jgi:hypothetical protein